MVGAEGVVVEQLLAPDIRADQRKLVPAHADPAGEQPLQGTQGALAGSGGAFGVDHDRTLLRRQEPVAFGGGSFDDEGIDKAADLPAAEAVAGCVGCNGPQQVGEGP